jgi:hypothetical protein
VAEITRGEFALWIGQLSGTRPPIHVDRNANSRLRPAVSMYNGWRVADVDGLITLRCHAQTDA